MSLHLHFAIHLPTIKHIVAEVEHEVAGAVELEIAAHPEASKDVVVGAVVAKADTLIELSAARVPGSALILPFLMGYLNHLIATGLDGVYDLVKSKLDEIASASVPAVAAS